MMRVRRMWRFRRRTMRRRKGGGGEEGGGEVGGALACYEENILKGNHLIWKHSNRINILIGNRRRMKSL